MLHDYINIYYISYFIVSEMNTLFGVFLILKFSV